MTRQEALALVLNAATNNQQFNPYEFKNGEMDCVVDDLMKCDLMWKNVDWLIENGFVHEVV